MVEFFVSGSPVPKQSYRHSRKGGYLPKRVKDWQELVGWTARSRHRGEPYRGKVQIDLQFYLHDKRKRDLDNLSKAILDSIEGIIIEDDVQVDKLYIERYFNSDNPGVMITVKEL